MRSDPSLIKRHRAGAASVVRTGLDGAQWAPFALRAPGVVKALSATALMCLFSGCRVISTWRVFCRLMWFSPFFHRLLFHMHFQSVNQFFTHWLGIQLATIASAAGDFLLLARAGLVHKFSAFYSQRLDSLAHIVL